MATSPLRLLWCADRHDLQDIAPYLGNDAMHQGYRQLIRAKVVPMCPSGYWKTVDHWRNIAVTLIDSQKGEGKAQACAIACYNSYAIDSRDGLQSDPFGGDNKMLKRRIKTVLVVVTLLFAATLSIVAQTSQTPAAQETGAQSNSISNQDIEMLRKDLRAQRKEITAQNVNLTVDEATKFWPVFDQYRQEAIKPNDERWALIKDYAANYNTMTDAQAQDYIKRSTDVEQQLIALRMKYVPVFEKVISPKKTALWYQIDRRIDLLINLQLSAQIPMVDTSR